MKLMQIDGLPVIDSRRPLILHITKNDCEKADPKRPEACAAARAIYRETHVAECRVHLGRVYLRSNKGNWQRYITPRSLRAEIIAFDRGGKFQPGEYILSAPQPSKRATGKAQGSSKNKSKRKSAASSRPRHIVKDVRTGPAG